MEDILEDINAVVGVTGCFVCNGEGQVLASALPDLFDKAILSTVGRTAAQTIAGLATARRRKVGDIDLLYRKGRVVVKNLREGCLCILCVRNINVPLLNMIANVAAKKLREKATREKELERVEAVPSGLSKALQAMTDFIEQLMEELGDKGFGRDDFLKIVEYRLTKLRASYPFLQSINIVDDRVDLSLLLSESLDDKEVGEALRALIQSICYSARGILGPEEAEAKYRQVYDSFYRHNEGLFESLGLGQTLEKAATEEPSLPLAGVDLSLS